MVDVELTRPMVDELVTRTGYAIADSYMPRFGTWTVNGSVVIFVRCGEITASPDRTSGPAGRPSTYLA